MRARQGSECMRGKMGASQALPNLARRKGQAAPWIFRLSAATSSVSASTFDASAATISASVGVTGLAVPGSSFGWIDTGAGVGEVKSLIVSFL